MLHITGIPSAPSNQAINLLTTEENEVLILLTWSQDNSRCVVVYHVEVTGNSMTNTHDTTSQQITLTLQIGVEYFFRVRGADNIDRGQWSGSMAYTYHLPTGQECECIECMHACHYNAAQVVHFNDNFLQLFCIRIFWHIIIRTLVLSKDMLIKHLYNFYYRIIWCRKDCFDCGWMCDNCCCDRCCDRCCDHNNL